MKVVVLCGGLNTERDISLLSGTRVCAALREKGHRAVLVDLFFGMENEDEEVRRDPALLFDRLPAVPEMVFPGKAPDLEAVRARRKWQSPSLFGPGVLEICAAADRVFVALHGMNGEDGRVQATFDMMGIPYTGSGMLGSALSMDKLMTKHMLLRHDIPMPAWREFTGQTKKDIPALCEAAQSMLPCVIKTTCGGSSVGVYIVRIAEEVQQAVEAVLALGPDVLIEEYIQGRELTCAVLQDRALPSVEIIPKTNFYDYANKYRAGATEEICPARILPETEAHLGELAVAVHRIMGLTTYSRSDFIVDDKERLYFLEVNTLPGMTPTSLVPQEAAAVGISFPDLCEIILRDKMTKEEGSKA